MRHLIRKHLSTLPQKQVLFYITKKKELQWKFDSCANEWKSFIFRLCFAAQPLRLVIVVVIEIVEFVDANAVDLAVVGMVVDVSAVSLVVADAEIVDDVTYEEVELITRLIVLYVSFVVK